jgi:hypothetical protein
VPLTPKGNGGNVPKPPQPASGDWKPIRVQVAAPIENSGDPGAVIEGEYAMAAGEVQVRYEGKLYTEAIKPGDDPVAVARRLLRAKWDKHGAFYGDIRYPHRSYH